MHDFTLPPTEIGEVVVQLLDTSSGRAIKAWTFKDKSLISIGRSPDQDVEMSDPHISRNHANLEFRDGSWRLISMGRNGVMVANQFITEYQISGDVSFRLGLEGPTFHFRTVVVQEPITSTISFDALPPLLFEIDEDKLENEVEEIAEGDYFQSLKRRARQMRENRKSD